MSISEDFERNKKMMEELAPKLKQMYPGLQGPFVNMADPFDTELYFTHEAVGHIWFTEHCNVKAFHCFGRSVAVTDTLFQRILLARRDRLDIPCDGCFHLGKYHYHTEEELAQSGITEQGSSGFSHCGITDCNCNWFSVSEEVWNNSF